MTRIKSLISAILVISHMTIMAWYYSHSDEWQIINANEASFWFFGIAGMIVGINMIIASASRYTPVQLEITKLHGVFILSLATIYTLHFSGILKSNNNEKYFMILTSIIVSVSIVFISAWRHGFFKVRD